MVACWCSCAALCNRGRAIIKANVHARLNRLYWRARFATDTHTSAQVYLYALLTKRDVPRLCNVTKSCFMPQCNARSSPSVFLLCVIDRIGSAHARACFPTFRFAHALPIDARARLRVYVCRQTALPPRTITVSSSWGHQAMMCMLFLCCAAAAAMRSREAGAFRVSLTATRARKHPCDRDLRFV